MEYFIFNVIHGEPKTSGRITTTIAFCPHINAVPESLRDALKRFFDTNLPPDNVLLLGLDGQQETLHNLSADSQIINSVPQFTGLASQQTIYSATIKSATPRAQSNGEHLPTLEQIRQQGILHLVDKYHALITASPHFHYQKTPSTHTDKFLRTANLLVRGPEIAFVAAWLVPHIADDNNYIFTDTPAIHSLAYAAVTLKKQIAPDFNTPVIDSFGSYSGIDNFAFRTKHLVIISASTSGNLQERLLRKSKTSEESLVTVLHNGKTQPRGSTLCNLTSEQFPHIENHKASSCAMCTKGIPLITIVGDHFIPDAPQVIQVLLEKNDSSRPIQQFLEEVTLKAFIRVNRHTSPDRHQRDEIFFDAEKLFSPEETAKDDTLSRILYKIPAKTERIIHVDDSGSKQLAESVKAIISPHLQRNIPLISANEVFADHSKYITEKGTTLVISSSMTSGRELLPISQILRIIQKNCSAEYLVGIARTRNKESLDQLSSNLQYGQQAKQHGLHILKKIFLPSGSDSYRNSWELETEFLSTFQQPKIPAAVRTVADARLEEINKDGGSVGLINALFWKSPDHQQLMLTANFALWAHRYDPNSASQADVYLTIVAILHQLREGIGRMKAWSNHHYNRHLISPSNFFRYNDGVIQASLLRAAHPSELDYRSDKEISQRMLDWIRFLITQNTLAHHSALNEFLLSLCLDRLRLAPAHHEEVVKLLKSLSDDTSNFFLYALGNPRF